MSSEGLLLLITAVAITIACSLEYVANHAEELERGASAPVLEAD